MVFQLYGESRYLHHRLAPLLRPGLLLRRYALLDAWGRSAAMPFFRLQGDDAAVQVIHLCLAEQHVGVYLLQTAAYAAPVLAVGKDFVQLAQADRRMLQVEAVHPEV